jgi:hypothetical protein
MRAVLYVGLVRIILVVLFILKPGLLAQVGK